MKRTPRALSPGATGFTLLPVVLAMSLTASVAFLLNRDNGINVDLISVQSDRERARYAAEAGLQAANYAVQAIGCAGGYPSSGAPVTDSNFGGAAYSAYVTTVGTTLTLTSTGSYNGASTTLTKSPVYAFQPGIQTAPAVQPDAVASNDTWVDPAAPNSTHGGSNEVRLDGGGRELLIQIGLPALPAGSKIVGANLMLFKNNTSGPAESISVMLITGTWSETFATWNNSTLIYDSLRPVSANPYAPVGGWQNLDLSAVAIAWQNGLYPNNGVRIRGGLLMNNAKFALSSESTAANRPKLVVTYLLPC